jgi:hypothetical protein
MDHPQSFAIAVVVIVLIAVLLVREARIRTYLRVHGQEVTATVTAIWTRRDTDDDVSRARRYVHRVTATWTDARTGQSFTFRARFRSGSRSQSRYVVGGPMAVLLDPANPARYRLHH